MENNIKLKEINGLTLAYLGDAIWELFIRTYFVKNDSVVKKLNQDVKKYVNAKNQSAIYLDWIESVKDLEEHKEYLDVARRAKNGKFKSVPKSCTLQEYKNATALEALIAAYYVDGKIEFIDGIIKKYVAGVK